MLYSHQKDMLKFSLSHIKCCYLGEVGTGKTRPSILTYYVRKVRGRASKCLIVCTAGTLYNWEDEIKMASSTLTSVVLYGRSYMDRVNKLKVDADFYIVNYDYIEKMEEELLEIQADILIVDELTYVKHHNTQRSKALRNVCKNIPYRIGLTGTFITNTPMDAFGEMLIIDPTLFGTNFYVFRNTYFENKGKYFPNWVLKSGSEEAIGKKLDTCCIKIIKSEVLDLPPVIFEKRKLDMPSQMLRDYSEMKKHLILELLDDKGGLVRAKAAVALTRILRLAQITSGSLINELNGECVNLGYHPKTDEAINIILNEVGGKKVIVWARFLATIARLKEKLIDLNPAVMCGATKDKQGEINKFQNDETCRVFIGQLATGYGYNLTSSDIMIYVEHDFSVEHRTQTLGRNNRIGQTSDKLTVIDLVIKGSIDMYTLDSLDKKQDVAQRIMDILK